MAIEYNFKYMPLVGKLSGKSMAEQTETAINEIAKIVNDNTAQAEIINTLAEEANANSVEALEKATEALDTSSRVYIKETGAVDLDSYCESQLIYINNIFSQNLPVESKGFLEVKTNDDKTQATQVFIDDLNKEIYTRSGAITETQVGDITTYTASYGAWNKSASTNYVENMVLIRQNSTAYSVGDIARSASLASYMLLECTSAGTTGASEPSFEGADVGDVITDGSVSWTIIKYASTEYVQEEVANYLPLSGGTMTGTLVSTQAITVRQNADNASSQVYGGTDGTSSKLILFGKANSIYHGAFSLEARAGSNATILYGTSDGALTWGGKNILTASNYNSYALPLSGGTLTGVLHLEDVVIREFSNTLKKGTNPSAEVYPMWFAYYDKSGFSTPNRVCGIGGIITTSGVTQMGLHAYKWVAESTDSASVYVVNPLSGDKYFIAGSDNNYTLGTSTLRWKQLYAATATINTSDERLKDNIETIPDEVLDAWAEVNWYQYQFKDSIAEKGENARLHTGAIAQRIESVFKAHGLDANRYGLLCYDEWEAEAEGKDDEGNVVTPAREAGNCYSLRYEEALCMEAAYQRRRADWLEERIEALEKLLMNRTE